MPLKKLPLDLSNLRSGYRTGDFTPAEVVREIHRRIAARGEDHVWIHLVPEEDAVAVATRLADQLDLPLAGIPFAVKDNIDVAGLPTTAGCPAYAYTPDRTATVVQRLLDAGAILIGKTNLDQFATGLVGTRSPHGAPASVFDPDFISGGSSAGSAVAVAADLVAFSLGTDTAGSGRVPAAFNNLIGLKPSRGLLSTTGVVPACRSLDCVSIFTNSVSDAEIVLQVAAAPDESDPYSRVHVRRPLFAQSFRFGVPPATELDFHGDDDCARLYAQALTRLERLGGTRLEIDYAPFREAAALLYEGPWVAERYAAVGEFIANHRDDCDPTVADIILKGATLTAAEAFASFHRLEALKRRASEVLDAIDFLALPTTPTTFKIAEVQADPIALNSVLGTYTNFVNLLDLAALAVPMGFRADGLPLGISFIGPACTDPQLCALGRAFTGASARKTELNLRPRLLSGADRVSLAVVGAHLSGFPLNHQLIERGAHLLEAIETSPDYALFSLPDSDPPKPGLVRVADNRGVAVEVEVWSIPVEEFGSFVAAVPSPLAIGTIRLADGRHVKGFLCEEESTHRAEPISIYGGWRHYLETR